MSLSAITDSSYSGSAVSGSTNAVQSRAESNSLAAVSTATDPTDIVTLSPVNTSAIIPPVYDKPTVDVSLLRNNVPGIAASKVSDTLLTTFNSARTNKAPFSVSGLFNQIGTLARETNQYKNEARSFRVPGNIVDKFSGDFSQGVGKANQSVTLDIRTKDGDKVQINVTHRTGSDGDSLEFSFSVDGKLSDVEQQAIEKITAKLGGVADEFFRTGATQLRGLKEIDTQTITEFDLSLSQPKGDDYATANYDFGVDQATGKQHLTAKDAEGYNVDIQANLLNLMGTTGSQNKKIFQQYIDLINQATTDFRSPDSSTRFLLDAFNSIFGATEVSGENSGMQEKNNAILSAFDSGLPDFTATFGAPTKYTAGAYLFPESMSLVLQQKTHIELQDKGLLIQQTNSFEYNSRQIKGLPGLAEGDMAHGNFTYQSTHKAGSIARTLDMTGDQVNNLLSEKTGEVNITRQVYENFNLQKQDNDKHSDRQLNQLADLIKTQQLNKKTSLLSAALENTKNNFFLDLK